MSFNTNWSGNFIWQNIYLDIDDGYLGMRYKVSNDYDAICEIAGQPLVYELVKRTLIIKNIGTVKVTRLLFMSHSKIMVIKSELLSTEGR